MVSSATISIRLGVLCTREDKSGVCLEGSSSYQQYGKLNTTKHYELSHRQFRCAADESEDSGPGGDALGLGYGSDDGSDSDAEDSQRASKQASESKQEISAPAQPHASTHNDSTASAQLQEPVHKEEAKLTADTKSTLGCLTEGTQNSAPALQPEHAGHDTKQAMHIYSKAVEPTYSSPAADVTAAKSEGEQQIKAEDVTAAKSEGEQQIKAKDIRPDSTAVFATVASAEVPDKMPTLANGSTCIALYSKGSR